MQNTSYNDLLDSELERRKQFNEVFTLSSYNRFFGILSPRLNLILKKREGISVEASEEIANNIKLNEQKKKWFCNFVGSLHASSIKEGEKKLKTVQEYKNEARVFSETHPKYFKVIGEFLNITPSVVQEANRRLTTLDLIVEKDGKPVDAFIFLAMPNNVPSASLKKINTQWTKRH